MLDKYRGEKILVFERLLLDKLGSFQGICTDTERYLSLILDKNNNHFHARFRAEDDPSLKQIIPYVIFKNGDEVFSYVRGKKAGEKRLVGNRSIGIGGHINPEDSEHLLSNSNSSSSDMGTYLEAVRREISEEVIVNGTFEPKIVALLNDDSNPVGQVHLGVIHVCDLSGQNVRKREQQITESGFIKISELAEHRREELESWSSIAIDFLLS